MKPFSNRHSLGVSHDLEGQNLLIKRARQDIDIFFGRQAAEIFGHFLPRKSHVFGDRAWSRRYNRTEEEPDGSRQTQRPIDRLARCRGLPDAW